MLAVFFNSYMILFFYNILYYFRIILDLQKNLEVSTEGSPIILTFYISMVALLQLMNQY